MVFLQSPIGLSSASWRGYYCKYSIDSGSLILSTLSIGLGGADPQVWRGIKAFGGGEFDYWTYEGVNLPINYSGGIIIGSGLFEEFHNIFGFYQPHCYQHVFELIFEKGKLVKTVVHDKYMNKAREIIRLSSQVYKKSIGYFEGTQSVTIRLPNQMDIKSFSLVVKDAAYKYISSTTTELFNKFRSKGYIELDKKMNFGEYRELCSYFERKGYKNIVLTAYSIDSSTHLDANTVIAQQPDTEQLLQLYGKYGLSNIFLL